jgi:hypothetical protein
VDPPAELPRNALGVVPRDIRAQVLAETTTAVQRAGTALPTEAAAVTHAAGELLHVLARQSEPLTIGPLTAAADRYDRAARAPRVVVPPSAPGGLAAELRSAARRVAGTVGPRDNTTLAGVALLLAVAALVAEIAAWHAQAQRHQQARAATACATVLTAGSQAPSRRSDARVPLAASPLAVHRPRPTWPGAPPVSRGRR